MKKKHFITIGISFLICLFLSFTASSAFAKGGCGGKYGNKTHGSDTSKKDWNKSGGKDCDKHGGKDCGKYGSKDCDKCSSKDCGKHGGNDCNKHGGKDCDKHGSNDCNKYGGKDCDKHGSNDCSKHGNNDCNKYGSKDCDKNGGKDYGKHGNKECITIEEVPWEVSYVDLESYYDASTDTTTFTYHVTVTDDPDLSHFVIQLPEEYEYVSAYPDWQIELPDRPDPTTGVAGIKWDGGQETGTETYSFTLAGNWETGDVEYSVKGGRYCAVATTTGPVSLIEYIPLCSEDDMHGWKVDYYDLSELKSKKMPDFDTLEPYMSDTIPHLALSATHSEFLTSGLSDYVGAVFTGYINIPVYGEYTIYLNSDDGSKLYIDDQLIINNDGNHLMREYAQTSTFTSGIHAIRIEYFEYYYTTGIILKWEGPEFARKLVTEEDIWQTCEYYDPQEDIDTDNDGLPDIWEIDYFGDLDEDVNGDPDNDGHDNLTELDAGTDPTVPKEDDPAALCGELQEGWEVKYYDYEESWGSYLPEYNALTPYAVDNLTAIDISLTKEEVLTSGREDSFGMQCNGYINVDQYGKYTFSLFTYNSLGNSSRLYIDEFLIVDNQVHSNMQSSGSCFLAEGLHKIRVEYISKPTDDPGRDGLSLEWAGPGFGNKKIDNVWHISEPCDIFDSTLTDNDRDGVSDNDEILLYETDPDRPDTDCDGLADGEEIFLLNINPLSIDTDQDNVTDREEVEESFTNPDEFDIDVNNVTNLAIIDGADTVGQFGDWTVLGTEIYSSVIGGYVEYNVNVSTPDTYRIKIQGDDNNESNDFSLKLKIFIDDEYIGEQYLEKENQDDEYGNLYVYTPWMISGDHTIKILFGSDCVGECEEECETGEIDCNMVTYGKTLRINTLTLQSIGGADQNQNGIKDWVDNRLNTMSWVNDLTSSFVSPVCIEGNAHFLSMMEINTGTPVNHTTSDKWYADVYLSASGSTSVTVSFQDGAKTTTQDITWETTNLLTWESAITVRTGDSLLLTAFPEGIQTGYAQITIDGVIYTPEINTPVQYQFTEPKTYELEASYTDTEGLVTTRTVFVQAIEYDFGSEVISSFTGKSRDFYVPVFPEGIVAEIDESMSCYRHVFRDSNGLSKYTVTLDDNQAHYAAARINQTGAILSVKKFQGIKICGSRNPDMNQLEAYYEIAEADQDGNIIINVTIPSSPVISDNITLDLKIILTGVFFEDGSTTKVLTSADFNETGQAVVTFIKTSAARKTSACHYINGYQNGQYIGTAY